MNTQKIAQRKILTYIALFVFLFVGYLLLKDSSWQGTKQLHTIMEIMASTLAFVVGIMALVRFHSKKESTFLFIGTGFLGTGLLDAYHTIVTSTFFDMYFPSPPPSLIPWSWVASRLFLAILLWLSWLAWRREKRLGNAGIISERTVYWIVSLLTIACFFFFAFVPLPRAYYPELFFHRPEELIPALFFLLALIGYLNKGLWKTDNFEHWLILSLIVGFMGQVMFMSFSGHLFDMMFDGAHLLKKVSYICVLIGLLANMYVIFISTEKSIQQLSETNIFFKTVIDDVVQVSQGLAKGNLSIMPKATYQGESIQIKDSLETALTNLRRVIEDIIQVSQELADGGKNVAAKAEYNGDFVRIKDALENAAAKLAEATARNAIQDWLKTGQTQLNEQISGEQNVITLAKNIITFLTTYLEAQVGVFYLLEGKGGKGERDNVENTYLKLIASYAYTERKGMNHQFKVGEGLIGQAALEKQRVIMTDVPEDYISIQSGLGESAPQQLVVIPFMYENAVKGIIEIGSFHTFTEVQLELLDQVMSNIGIAVNTAESRTKMQVLLQG
ncbi:MASE3 domain-containing protein [Candidatus Parabeggiatoa sp. HSG14]|uniref:MASE3 domain-containing protein n=1 Tax=Candidatus Parabeggiatoa sp. HSG14 TaxID=3055593 RepID=UPI0025A7B311|nr:MASE3 domain-containing protein [Thiotrichales bacterium HSG14]